MQRLVQKRKAKKRKARGSRWGIEVLNAALGLDRPTATRLPLAGSLACYRAQSGVQQREWEITFSLFHSLRKTSQWLLRRFSKPEVSEFLILLTAWIYLHFTIFWASSWQVSTRGIKSEPLNLFIPPLFIPPPHNGRTVAPEAILFESPCRAHPET